MSIQQETKITFVEAARQQPSVREGRPCHPNTIANWAKKGVLIHGRRIKLEVFQRGGVKCTTIEALRRFQAACDAVRAAGPIVVEAGSFEAAGAPS